ncbi:hypothetical protein ABFY09_04960 [Marinomonas sp. 5E14-1]|uniref:hypothetical protein n=1 Tax=Marinomonas sp. 5E14-1 TaxID=3153922 RepID=UPI0032679B73
MNGFETVKAIREIQEKEKQKEWFPIIFLSASANDYDVEQGIRVGGDYLIKSINQKILVAKMLAMKRISDMRRRLVDKFKAINDIYGYAAGGEVLAEVVD